jgi:hypothetical protein
LCAQLPPAQLDRLWARSACPKAGRIYGGRRGALLHGTIDDPCSETELCAFFIKEKEKQEDFTPPCLSFPFPTPDTSSEIHHHLCLIHRDACLHLCSNLRVCRWTTIEQRKFEFNIVLPFCEIVGRQTKSTKNKNKCRKKGEGCKLVCINLWPHPSQRKLTHPMRPWA